MLIWGCLMPVCRGLGLRLLRRYLVQLMLERKRLKGRVKPLVEDEEIWRRVGLRSEW